MSYAAAQFRIWAKVYGSNTIIDVVRFVCGFQRNSIPTATLSVPLGKEVESWQNSSIYNLTPGSMARIRIQVGLEGYFGGTSWQPGTGPPPIVPGLPGVPNGFIIFDGWLSGMGYEREREKVYAKLDLTHWLGDLNFASAMCQASNPGNPANLIIPADLFDTLGGADPEARKYVTPENITSDFWSATLYPWFAWMLSTNRLFKTEFMEETERINDAADGSGALALARMLASPAAKLDFALSLTDATTICEGVVKDLVQNVNDPDGEELSLANVTIWEKLVGHIVPTYHFDIIPRPGDALIRPVVPSLKITPYVTILARDQSVVKLNAGLQRPIRAVGLFSNDLTGGTLDKPGAPTGVDMVGLAESPQQPTGLFLFRQAPTFFVHAGDAGRKYTEFIDDYADIMNGPNQGIKGRANSPVDSVETSIRNRLHIGNLLAQIMYMEEALKERHGVIVGPVRLDVCPGSTICVQGIENPDTFFHALVQGVNYFIDADQQQAATAFQIAYMRSEAENNNPTLVATSHPLFKSVWAGDTMFTGHSGYAWSTE